MRRPLLDADVAAGVRGRSRVRDLVRDDPGSAAAEARKIAHPWYRCQSLATVAAELASNDGAAAMLREALAAAHEQSEPNRVVSVASWPLEVMVKRNVDGVEQETARLLELIAPEPNPLRRADALYLLLCAVFARETLRERVLEPLLAALQTTRGWKGRRLLGFTALTMARESRERAERILDLIPPSKEQRRARSMIAAALDQP